MGYYYYWGHREYAQALDQFTLALQGAPNDAEVAEAMGLILRRQGKFEQALASLKRAAALDPRSYSDMVEVGDTYLWMRAFPQAERELNRAVALAPDLPFARSFLALLYLNWQGSLEVPRRILREGLSRIDLGRLTGILPYHFSLIAADDPFQPEVARLTPSSFNGDTLTYFVFKANVYRYRGERNEAGAYDDSTRTEALAIIARKEDDAFTEAHLAVADAYLGRSKEAIEAGERAEAITPLSQDALAGQFGLWALARVYAVSGNTSAALDHLEPLLAMPSFLAAGQLRIDPAWAPLRGNPRFQRLLAGK
jgi:serine/threonine-protein kinase